MNVLKNGVTIVNNFERAYSTREVADTLSIADSTLRKWSMSLEKNGYTFSKNEQGYRLFIERDIIVLRQFKKLVQEANMPLDNASNIVVERYKEESFSLGTGVVPIENKEIKDSSLLATKEQVEEIMKRLEKQEVFNQKLIEMLQKQQETIEHQQLYIQERLEMRDQMLMESLRQSQETKKLLAAAQEEKKKRKSLFNFFGKA